MSNNKRHEVAKQNTIRVDDPFGKKEYVDLSLEEKRFVIWAQLKELGSMKKQQHITCLCKKVVPIMYAYRCYYCGVFFCPKCAGKHFDYHPESFEKDRDRGK